MESWNKIKTELHSSKYDKILNRRNRVLYNHCLGILIAIAKNKCHCHTKALRVRDSDNTNAKHTNSQALRKHPSLRECFEESASPQLPLSTTWPRCPIREHDSNQTKPSRMRTVCRVCNEQTTSGKNTLRDREEHQKQQVIAENKQY